MNGGKKMKKIIAIGLMLILLTGCGGSGGSSKNRLDEILERGYIEVATEPYFAPGEFIDPSKSGDEQYQGSDIELAKYIAEKLGVELKIVPLEFGAVLSGVAEGKYDMAISMLAYTPERAEAMNLSEGYYYSTEGTGHGMMIRAEDKDKIKTPEDLKDMVVVAQSGSLQEMFVNEQVPEYKEFKKVSATTDGFLMVQENKADVAIVSKNMASLYIEANPEANLMIVEDFRFELPREYDGNRIGMPKGEDELTAKVNEIIAEIVEDGTYEKWYQEYSEYAKSLGL